MSPHRPPVDWTRRTLAWALGLGSALWAFILYGAWRFR